MELISFLSISLNHKKSEMRYYRQLLIYITYFAMILIISLVVFRMILIINDFPCFQFHISKEYFSVSMQFMYDFVRHYDL